MTIFMNMPFLFIFRAGIEVNQNKRMICNKSV